MLNLLLIIALAAWVFTLQEKVSRLEGKKDTRPTPAISSPNQFSQPEVVYQTPVISRPSRQADTLDRFGAWFKEDWLMKLGALLLIIGFGWFVSYAFANNWIGPVGRIMLGLVAGVGILALGTWRIPKFIHQGAVLLVVGATTIILTIYAAREIYDFFTPLVALIGIFIASAYVALLSAKYQTRALAFISLLFAFLAPLLVSSAQPSIVSLFNYLLVVVLGAIWLAWARGWRFLILTSLVGVFLYSGGMILSGEAGDGFLHSFLFTIILFVAHTTALYHGKATRTDIVSALGTGLFLLMWVWVEGKQELQSLTLSAWAVVFAFGSFALFRHTGKRESFLIYAATGLLLIAVAIALEFQGAVLLVAYTALAALATTTVQFVMRDPQVTIKVAFLQIIPAGLASIELLRLNDSWLTFNRIFTSSSFLGILFFIIVAFVLGYFLKKYIPEGQLKSAPGYQFVLGTVFSFALLWVVSHRVLFYDWATLLSLAVYTIVGLITYFWGSQKVVPMAKVFGAMVLGGVVLRLLLVDVWGMALTGRIVTFFLIGALLISTAFYSKKKISNTTV